MEGRQVSLRKSAGYVIDNELETRERFAALIRKGRKTS